MSLKKKYLKNLTICKVTFTVPKKLADSFGIVHLVGAFNDWNTSVTAMRRLKNGSFTATLSLSPNTEYEFRYLLDDRTWANDPQADKYVSNAHGSENSVVVV